MGAFVGNNGKKEVKEIYVGVGSQLRKIKEGYIGVNGTPRLFYSRVRKTWIFDSNGSWKPPITGYYDIELHGGGSGGAGAYYYNSKFLGSQGGSGSGEIFKRVYLDSNTSYNITIGRGGEGAEYSYYDYDYNDEHQGQWEATGKEGGSTRFGNYSVSGGPNVSPIQGYAEGSGSLGKPGTFDTPYGEGGSGGCTNPDYSWAGTGGAGGSDSYLGGGSQGSDGLVIVTLVEIPKLVPTIDINYYYNDQAYSAWVEISTNSNGLITWEWINSHGAGQPLNNASGSGYNGMTINFSNGFRYITDGTIVVKVAETNQYAAATKELKIDHSNYYMQD